mmetsp:Transcript_32381/g.58848  ORF Transcript_32381/g.58848 Transcript_32381/m.58848 type:complete len:269 (-) Transcript_32381:202-1008(-)
MPQHGFLLQAMKLTAPPSLNEVHELCELGTVGLDVALGEAVHSRWHQVAISSSQLYSAGVFILCCEHSFLTKGLHTLVVAICSITAGVYHRKETAWVLEDDSNSVKIVHLFDGRIVAMPHRCDRLRYLTFTQEVEHVKVVNQHVVEYAAAGSQVLKWRQRVVPAAGFYHFQLTNCAAINLALELAEVTVCATLVAANKRQVLALGKLNCLDHLIELVRDWLFGQNCLIILQCLHDVWEMGVSGRRDDHGIHAVESLVGQFRRPLTVPF